METFVKLYRKTLTSTVFDNPHLLKTFIWCLLKASYAEHDQMVGFQVVHLMPGQFVYGRFAAGEELKLKPSTAHAYMLKLKAMQIVDIKGNSKYSVVTVLNWAFYQTDSKTSDIKPDNSLTPNRQQTDTNNNDKNGKNEKNKAFVPPTLTEVEEYCRQRNNGVDPKKFFDFFTAGSWIDSKGKPVKSWKQKIITWEQYNTKETPSAPATPKRKFITTGTDDIGNPTGYFVDEGSDTTA